MYPTNYPEVAQARREDLLREAEKERLIKFVQEGQPTWKDRLQVKLARLLGKVEKEMQEHHLPTNTAQEGSTQY